MFGFKEVGFWYLISLLMQNISLPSKGNPLIERETMWALCSETGVWNLILDVEVLGMSLNQSVCSSTFKFLTASGPSNCSKDSLLSNQSK